MKRPRSATAVAQHSTRELAAASAMAATSGRIETRGWME
jgi:hypothetical protein